MLVVTKPRFWSSVIFLATFALALPSTVKADYIVDCSGATPGAFTSIQAAVNALSVPQPGQWNNINVLSDCTENVSISGQHSLRLQQGWWGMWSGQSPVKIRAQDGTQPVISISGSQDVEIDNMILTGGSVGLSIGGGSSVTALIIKATGNSGDGIEVAGNSSLNLNDGGATGNTGSGIYLSGNATLNLFGSTPWLPNPQPYDISGNSGNGILLDRALLEILGGVLIHDNSGAKSRSPGAGIEAYAGKITMGNWTGVEPVIRHNPAGVALLEGSDLTMWGGVIVQDNATVGVEVAEGGRALFEEVGGLGSTTIEQNPTAGVDVTNHSEAKFLGHNKIMNNGSTTDHLGAGIRVDGTSEVTLEGGNEVMGNIGPGIFADINSSLEVTDTTIGANTGEGIRLRHMSIAEVQGATAIGGNGGGPLTCDSTSLAATSLIGRSLLCPNIAPPSLHAASALDVAPSADMEIERARRMAERLRRTQ
jgi:hypothetical protein